MRIYLREILTPYLGVSPTTTTLEWETPLPDCVAEKAQGVFLWLHLATRSLICGLDNGDHKRELEQCLTQLPHELSELYSDMWARLGEDAQMYCETTALYFNLILDARAVNEFLGEAGCGSPYDDRGVDLLQFMVATQPPVQTAFLDERGTLPASHLHQLCTKTSNAVHVRCAGLIELVSTMGSTMGPERSMRRSTKHAILEPHINTELSIHRTAYDFIFDTEEGHKVRAHDPSSESDRKLWLARGFLVAARLRRQSWFGNDVRIAVGLVQNLVAPEHQQELLRVCWEWYDAGDLRCFEAADYDLPPIHFLAAVAQPSLEHFIQSSITASPNPSLLATRVLRDIFGLPYVWEIKPHLYHSIFTDLPKLLLSLGADTKSRDSCNGLRRKWCWGTSVPHLERTSGWPSKRGTRRCLTWSEAGLTWTSVSRSCYA